MDAFEYVDKVMQEKFGESQDGDELSIQDLATLLETAFLAGAENAITEVMTQLEAEKEEDMAMGALKGS